MIKKNIIQTIRNKEMDRKDFLKYSGIALLGLIGLKGLISLLDSNNNGFVDYSQKVESRGFGGGKYGV